MRYKTIKGALKVLKLAKNANIFNKMAKANLILDTRKAKKYGTFPIKLAISHKIKTAYILAKISVPEKYWKIYVS
jgi:hypothetical protein